MVPHSDGSIRAVMFTFAAPGKGRYGPGIDRRMQDITGTGTMKNAIETRLRNERRWERSRRNCWTRRRAARPSFPPPASAGGDRRRQVYLFENFEDPDDGLCMRQTHEVCAPGVSTEMDNPELQHLPYHKGFTRWLRKLPDGMPVIGTIEDFRHRNGQFLNRRGFTPCW